MHPHAPLVYPPHYPPTDRWKRFFIGVRWLGPDLSFFKDLRALQASRTPGSMDLWGGGARRDLAESVGATFARHLHWPSPYFLPGDSLAAITGGPKFTSIDDLEAQDAVDEIEENLGVKMSLSFWERAASGPLGDLIDQLLRAAMTPDDSFRPA